MPAVIPTINEAQLSELHRNIVSPQSASDASDFSNSIIIAGYAGETLERDFIYCRRPIPTGETVNRLAGQTAQLLNGIPLTKRSNVWRLTYSRKTENRWQCR